MGLAPAQAWFHLYNEEDGVFTAPLKLTSPNFEQVDTFFGIEGVGDHAAEQYLRHENTVGRVWRAVALPREPSRTIARTYAGVTRAQAKPRRCLWASTTIQISRTGWKAASTACSR
jgi:hypothetical protein